MEQVRWLSEDELGTWMVVVGLMVRLPSAFDRQLQADAGLSHFDYGIMATLSEAPDRTRQMSSIAAYNNGSLSRLSHAVKRLEDRGWVRRAASRADGRLTEATLTDAGMEKVRQSAPGHVARVRSLVIDALSPEQLAQLEAIGRTILARIDAEGSPT